MKATRLSPARYASLVEVPKVAASSASGRPIVTIERSWTRNWRNNASGQRKCTAATPPGEHRRRKTLVFSRNGAPPRSPDPTACVKSVASGENCSALPVSHISRGSGSASISVSRSPSTV